MTKKITIKLYDVGATLSEIVQNSMNNRRDNINDNMINEDLKNELQRHSLHNSRLGESYVDRGGVNVLHNRDLFIRFMGTLKTLFISLISRDSALRRCDNFFQLTTSSKKPHFHSSWEWCKKT